MLSSLASAHASTHESHSVSRLTSIAPRRFLTLRYQHDWHLAGRAELRQRMERKLSPANGIELVRVRKGPSLFDGVDLDLPRPEAPARFCDSDTSLFPHRFLRYPHSSRVAEWAQHLVRIPCFLTLAC